MRASGDDGRAGDGEGEGQSRVETTGYVTMGNEGSREVGTAGADGWCSFLGATRNINKPLLTAGPAKPNTSNTPTPVSPHAAVSIRLDKSNSIHSTLTQHGPAEPGRA